MKSLAELYERMLLIRRAEEYIISHYPEDAMKTPMHLSMGQEHVSVGVCAVLGPHDQVVGSYRSHALYLAKTGDVEGFFAEMHGLESGPGMGVQGSMHLANPSLGHVASAAVVGSQIPMALGLAYGAIHTRMENRPGVVACFFGDGALDSGVFWESLNIAVLMRLPIMFVYEDNGVAVETSNARRWGFCKAKPTVEAHGCRVYDFPLENPYDVYAISSIAGCAYNYSIRGNPAFIHAPCVRQREHVGVKAWRQGNGATDPIISASIEFSQSELDQIGLRVDERISRAINVVVNGS